MIANPMEQHAKTCKRRE